MMRADPGGEKAIRNLRVGGLRLSLAEDEAVLPRKAASALAIDQSAILAWSIYKKSLDARKSEPQFVYILDIALPDGQKFRSKGRDIHITAKPASLPYLPKRGHNALSLPPLVIGAGPAGLFAALFLAKEGYRPLVLEQGKDVDQRVTDVDNFWLQGILERDSNVQFGEGGAGTFSDGKLIARTKDHLAAAVLEELVAAGADPQILYWHKPHIGSDVLITIVKNLRHKIIALGGRIIFSSKVEELICRDDKITAVRIKGLAEPLEAGIVILAPGNSARDTYRMLIEKGVALAVKPFAIGLRIEHRQALIDSLQYGKYSGHPALGAADYRLVFRDDILGRGVYTFCMCPGGRIVNAASEPGGLCTNGISYASRDSGKANSAIVATVGSADFGSDPLAALKWQESWEKLAYQAGGGDYSLPYQMAEDFVKNKTGGISADDFLPLAKGVKAADLRSCLPQAVSDSICLALIAWERQMAGFIKPPAVLAGIETRTSAPLRILRGEDLQSVNKQGLYPAGEGAGYAGGIVSSAIDGVKAARSVIGSFDRPMADFAPDFWQKMTTSRK